MNFSLKLCIMGLVLSRLGVLVPCASTTTQDPDDPDYQTEEQSVPSTPEPKIFEHNNPVVSVKCRIFHPPQNGKCVDGMCMTAHFTMADVQACLDNPDGGCLVSSGEFVEGICKDQHCISKHGQRDWANQDCLDNID